MTRFAVAVAAALAIAVLAGCGGDGDSVADKGSAAAMPAPDPATSEPSTATPSPGLAAALSDVRTIAPRLESFYRSGPYPRELADVIASMPKAGLKPSADNSLGAYRYDADSVEFVLCIENTSGAFATYDTAPMALGDQGETGGCPTL